MYDLLYTINFLSKEALDDYVDFIESCKNKELREYVERHHILPKSLFPSYKKDKANIIKLNARDHFLAHVKLAKAYGGPMVYALFRLTHNFHGDYEVTPDEYQMIKEETRKVRRGAMKKQWADGTRSKEKASNDSKMRWANPAYKEAVSKSIKESYENPELRKVCGQHSAESWADDKIRNTRMEKLKVTMSSDEYRSKQSDIQKERLKDPRIRAACGWRKGKIGMTYEHVSCPHCYKSGGKNAMVRYHFDNCKLKSVVNL